LCGGIHRPFRLLAPKVHLTNSDMSSRKTE
jgi:hypothetical protein